jgi:predicted GIY-YIG superfamily endonuclease
VGSNPTLSANQDRPGSFMTDREWFFYMVRCKDDSIYSGIAVDVAERLKKHNNGTGARYTAIHRPVVLIYWEKYDTISNAMKRESQVKRWSKPKKEQLAHRFYDMNKEVQAYIEKQKSPQQEICLKLREIILKTFPDTKEEMKWGVPTFSGGRFYIGAMKNQVNLGFSINGLTGKQVALFEGSGKTMRHIKIRALQDIDEKKIVKLLKMAGKCPEG